MAHVGYARVSSVGQSLAVQLAKLQAVGCDPIFQEKASGTRDDRPALHECLAQTPDSAGESLSRGCQRRKGCDIRFR